MDQKRPGSDAQDSGSGEPEGDYSYDLVHDEVPQATRGEARSVRAEPPTPEARPEGSGDYSYDLAHDVPPPRPKRRD